MLGFTRRFIAGAMLAGIALVVLLFVMLAAIFGGSNDEPEQETLAQAVERALQATPTPAVTQTQQPEASGNLSPPGTMRVLRVGETKASPTATPEPKAQETTVSEKSVQQPAAQNVAPPPPPAPATKPTVNGKQRRESGAGYKATFSPGEAVVGYEISIGGLKYPNCYMASTPDGGTVTDGVINPWEDEVSYAPCGKGVVDPTTVNGAARRGPGPFEAGEAVTGYFTMNGKQYNNCYLAEAPAGGTVTDGVINPWKGEVAAACGN